jgi:hypothetical protein
MLCIHVPIREISCPLKNNWKLRCRKARNAAGRLLFDAEDFPEFRDWAFGVRKIQIVSFWMLAQSWTMQPACTLVLGFFSFAV